MEMLRCRLSIAGSAPLASTHCRQRVMIKPLSRGYLVELAAIFLIILQTNEVIADSTAASRKHVCIIGAGIAGASTAYFLSRLQEPPRISVFEKESIVGGRVRSLYACGEKPIEAGASIIASENRLMRHFAKILNLTEAERRSSNSLGLWNGKKFAVRTAKGRYKTIALFLMRYGNSIFRARWSTRHLLNQYNLLYPKAGVGASWHGYRSVESLLNRTELYNLSQKFFEQVVGNMLSQRYIDEMITAIIRVNYGQNVEDMNALAGFVALAGSGSGLWSISGGNQRIIGGLLRLSGAELRLDTRVFLVRRREGGGFSMVTESTISGVDQPNSAQDCDAIVLASPVELANVTLPDDIASLLDVNRSFQQTVATFVRGELNFSTFGVNAPDTVLTVAGSDEMFTSIGLQCDGNSSHSVKPLWKVFSRERLSQKTITRLFDFDAEIIATVPWLAYPKYAPPERFAPFVADEVHGAFFYTSPLESAGAAMEMSALSGANAAALLAARLNLGKVTDEDIGKDEL